ncbi:tRNA lysidine(34) synthetase TilS [Candidatus Saccharibacteria bacterium]|nr:tRNA lysidine(34) synthetase TilS [Candidatus Saccharibacteria bacterium]MCB9821021.1 tRNA lysidine(34) synthetase TilS [Candidatus Nomurabacteria bacterium]
MIQALKPGKYVVAVSGGVDSVALLHALTLLPDVELVVAHFDHGIRPDSNEDAKHVLQLAKKYGLPFELGEASLGPNVSEELARDMRYNFLKIAAAKHSADGIITAHHQDDLIETAIINMSRGTGRHGLSSLRTHSNLIRPLLSTTKQELRSYAESQGLVWRDDSSNTDNKYLRNYIRNNIVPKLSSDQRDHLLHHINRVQGLNQQIDSLLDNYVTHHSYRRGNRVYSRSWFNQLPHDFAASVLHHILRNNQVSDYTKKQIDLLVVKIKAGRPGSLLDLDGEHQIGLTKRSFRLLARS